jgi:chromosome partitioning protein
MAVIVGVVSQKGGVGKSTIARLIAREFAVNNWNVKIADLDVSQGTSYHWQARRLQNAVEPAVAVERFGTVEQALKIAPHYDLLVLDGPPHSTAGTLRIAESSDLVVLPTGLSLDDLQPSVLLAHEMVKKGIPSSRIVFAICRVGDSESEIGEAREYITGAGYQALPGTIPEKIAYRRASDEGRTLTETRFPTLNERGDQIAQAVADRITAHQKAEVA